jgi:hypothetical protein
MYATCRESYVMQVVVLLEAQGHPRDVAILPRDLCKDATGGAYVGLDEALTDDFAADVARVVRGLPPLPSSVGGSAGG